MRRFKTSTFVAAFAVASMSAAIAQTTTPGQQTVPATPDPTVRSLDDTTQRAHDPKQSGAAPRATRGAEPTQGSTSAQTGAAGVRDWNAIDTNRDHLIQPEEMEASLQQAWAQKGSKK
jgi:hypothetical protein